MFESLFFIENTSANVGVDLTQTRKKLRFSLLRRFTTFQDTNLLLEQFLEELAADEEDVAVAEHDLRIGGGAIKFDEFVSRFSDAAAGDEPRGYEVI